MNKIIKSFLLIDILICLYYGEYINLSIFLPIFITYILIDNMSCNTEREIKEWEAQKSLEENHYSQIY